MYRIISAVFSSGCATPLTPDVQVAVDFLGNGSNSRCEFFRLGVKEVLVLDLTRPDIGLPVARVIVPGLRHL